MKKAKIAEQTQERMACFCKWKNKPGIERSDFFAFLRPSFSGIYANPISLFASRKNAIISTILQNNKAYTIGF